MQRTFSSFPSGWAGAALLVLRLVVGASATLEAGLTIARNHTPAHIATIAAASVAIAGLTLIIGFLTPIASVFVCLMGAVIMVICIPPAALLLFNSRMAAFEFVVMSAMLVILGPGAISVDARLFGRREVAIRRASRPNRHQGRVTFGGYKVAFLRGSPMSSEPLLRFPVVCPICKEETLF